MCECVCGGGGALGGDSAAGIGPRCSSIVHCISRRHQCCPADAATARQPAPRAPHLASPCSQPPTWHPHAASPPPGIPMQPAIHLASPCSHPPTWHPHAATHPPGIPMQPATHLASPCSQPPTWHPHAASHPPGIPMLLPRVKVSAQGTAEQHGVLRDDGQLAA